MFHRNPQPDSPTLFPFKSALHAGWLSATLVALRLTLLDEKSACGSDPRPIRQQRGESGFTVVEILTVITLIGLMTTMFYVTFNTNISQYLALQKDGSEFTDLAYQSQRIGNVMRGITDIISADADSIDCYAYFSPNDNYVSEIKYYKNAAGTALMADVTPMTANPPIGSLITAKKRTFTIISDFYQSPAIKTFTYKDDIGSTLSLPIADEHTIKQIQISLASRGAHNSDQTVTLQVSLRNRKTNL